MAAPAFVAAQTSVTGSGGPNLTITVPAGTAVGQRLLLVVSHQCTTPGTPTVSAGWTLVEETTVPTTSGGYTTVWTALVTTSGNTDPGDTVTVTFPANSKSSAAIVAYAASDVLDSNLDQSNPDSQSTVTTPTATSLVDTRVVHIYGTMMNGSKTSPDATVVSWTPHASTTERADIGSAAAAAGTGRQATVMVADEQMLGGGTSTARTATPSEAVRARSAVVLLGTTVTQPTANAGPDQTVALGATVNLNGTASGGAGAPFTYQWTQTSGPAVSLSSPTAEDPTFTAPSSAATLVFSLVVTDSGAIPSDPDTVTITVLGATNTAVPVTDITTSGWAKEPSSAASVADTIGDNTDTTYAYYEDPVGTVVLEVGLSGLTAPGVGQPVTVWYRSSIFEAAGGTVTVSLKQGASTVIATFAPDAWSTADTVQLFSHALSSSQIAAITDWNALRLRFEGSVS